MITSIRRFLLIYLLLALAIMTTLTAVGNYYLNQLDIQQQLDTYMAISALSYKALIGNDYDKVNFAKLQKSLNEINEEISRYYHHHFLNTSERKFLKKFKLQVIDDTGELLLRSSGTPAIPLSGGNEGFSDNMIDNHLWRVFTTYNPVAGLMFRVGERYDSRNELGQLIAHDDFYIMLFTFPISGLLIWLIIGRGLSSLNRVAEEVSSRAPAYLEPVELKNVPIEIKPVINELNKLFLRLQQAFEREKRFAADAAHELKTPLAALKTQAEVAVRTTDDRARNNALRNVIAGVNRSTHVVQQLLTMSRLVPEATTIEPHHRVNLEKLAAEMIAQLAPNALEKNIELALDCTPPGIQVPGNMTALSILLRNIIDNAIRYTPDGGHVHVTIGFEGDRVLLQVTDTGPGIPAELRARVFERFFRVLGNKSPGSGLGLAIVQQIAKLHGAELRLSTPPSGKGLVISILFPDPD